LSEKSKEKGDKERRREEGGIHKYKTRRGSEIRGGGIRVEIASNSRPGQYLVAGCNITQKKGKKAKNQGGTSPPVEPDVRVKKEVEQETGGGGGSIVETDEKKGDGKKVMRARGGGELGKFGIQSRGRI